MAIFGEREVCLAHGMVPLRAALSATDNLSRHYGSEPESLLEFSVILKGGWAKEGEVEPSNYIPYLVKS